MVGGARLGTLNKSVFFFTHGENMRRGERMVEWVVRFEGDGPQTIHTSRDQPRETSIMAVYK